MFANAGEPPALPESVIMRTFYVRRKDLDHVPFQYYIGSDGVARPMEDGYTGVFTIIPPRGDIDTVYVRITQDLMQEFAERWDISQGALIRVAAKGVEAWLKRDAIPEDHFYGPEWIKMDREWYLRDSDDSPAMAVDPYSFEVVTDEPGPSILDWDFSQPRQDESPTNPSNENNIPAIIFGFTIDVFPGMLIVGYEQLKRKVEEAGINAQVKMLALDALPANVHTLIVPIQLEQSARQAAATARVIALAEMVNAPIYETLIQELNNEEIAVNAGA